MYAPDSTTDYTYDKAGRLTKVSANGSVLARYTYNADSTLDTVTDGAGNQTTYSYTLLKQVAELTTISADGILIYSESNTYDRNGSLLERVTGGTTVQTEQTGSTVTAEYTYDALDRLLSENVDGQRVTYTYDSMGNHLTKTVDGIRTAYTYDLANKLLGEVTELPVVTEEGVRELTTTYRYDAVGNLTEKVTSEISETAPAENQVTTYTYDALNQLTNVTNPDGTWQESTYASGIRSMISENGITTEYVTFNGLVIAGYEKRNGQIEHYYYGTSLLATELASITKEKEENGSSTTLYYCLKNSHGDVIGLTDNNGTLTETYTYDAFGTLTYIQSLNEDGILAKTDTALGRFLYAGEQEVRR